SSEWTTFNPADGCITRNEHQTRTDRSARRAQSDWRDRMTCRVGVRGSVAVRRLANPVTLCDDHGVFFVTASGQIRMLADRRPDSAVVHIRGASERPLLAADGLADRSLIPFRFF